MTHAPPPTHTHSNIVDTRPLPSGRHANHAAPSHNQHRKKQGWASDCNKTSLGAPVTVHARTAKPHAAAASNPALPAHSTCA